MNTDDRFRIAAVEQALAAGQAPAAAYAEELARTDRALHLTLHTDEDAPRVVAARATAVDALLAHVWRRLFPESRKDIALVAVGGYGRGELHPCSDVDLLILLADPPPADIQEPVESLVALLWDADLQLGHSVRTVHECVEAAAADVTVATTLMESRLLAGDPALYEAMKQATGPDRIWPAPAFFRAKLAEQVARHAKFDDTAYRLEPNIKEGPGGLRDIQMVGWVAKRHFGAESLAELVDYGFLTPGEHARLAAGQALLWRIRWQLHRMTGRGEDRLLFDHQQELAAAFDARPDPDSNDPNDAVERFMQRYYRAVMELQRLNEILLQFFREAILEPVDTQPVRRLNDRFRIRGETLETARPDVFRQSPTAMLEMFLLLARHPEIREIRAETLRRLRNDLSSLNDDIRRDESANRLFLELLRQPRRVAQQLVRMNRHGVLGAWLPAFDRIVGRMQYDLFHAFTVDEHTLRVIRNLRAFRVGRSKEELPLCTELMSRVEEPELLYLAALFHDIAKGRDGDHSLLGADDAATFCGQLGLSSVQTGLVTWLVQHHLLMSMTAQRRDLNDPTVIFEFARTVSSLEHLNALYLLTVADIRATNPSLWNSWKDSLLRELHHKATQALRRGLDNPIDKDERVADTQQQALRLLANAGIDEASVNRIWQDLGERYFLRHNADEIAWHTQGLLEHNDRSDALVLLRRETQRGSTELFISCPDNQYRFALVTAVLDRLGLSVVDARIVTSLSGRTLDTFLILEASGDPIADEFRIRDIQDGLTRALATPNALPAPTARRTPRRIRHFNIPLRVEAAREPGQALTAVEVTATDEPGLLSKIARAFLDAGVRVHSARIATIGERIDDVFFVTDQDNQAIDAATVTALESAIARRLSNTEPQ